MIRKTLNLSSAVLAVAVLWPPDQEVGRLCRVSRFLVSPVALAGDLPGLNPLPHREPYEDQGHNRSDGQADSVPPGKPAHAVESARGTGQHRFMLQVPADISRQVRRRAVAAGAVLLQRPHRDPVEITRQLSLQGPQIRPASFGRR